jgi:hypothetical protein
MPDCFYRWTTSAARNPPPRKSNIGRGFHPKKAK